MIPNFNRRRFLPALLQSLAEQSQGDFESIVIDDGSTDDSTDYVRAAWPGVKLHVNPRNLGFAATVNRRIRHSDTRFVALLNNDTYVDRDWFREAMRAFDAPDIGTVASLTLLADPPHRIDTAGDVYSVAGGAVKRLAGCAREAAADAPADIFSASGVAAFYRRAALNEVGLLDGRMQSYYEDVDLGFRLQWGGWRCVLAPKSICYHHLSATYGARSWTYHFNSSRNAEIIWWSCMSPALRRRYLGVHLFCLSLQGARAVPLGRFPAWLAGKLQAMRMGRHIRARRRMIARIARISEEQMLARLERDWFGLHVTPKLREMKDMIHGP